MFPTLEDIQSAYPDAMTADMNEGLVRKWLEELPEYKKTVTSWDGERHAHINTYIEDDVIETDEFYPQCNYCVGGALQMAFGETEPDDVDSSRDGIFPASDVLADTLHYYCEIPYGYEEPAHTICKDSPTCVRGNYPCFFPDHKGRDCFTNNSMGGTAYELADKITRANDRGDFDEAWSYVDFVLTLGRRTLKENK